MSWGVMIRLDNNFEQKVKKVETDKNGNHIILDIEIQGKDKTLANFMDQMKTTLIFMIW